MKTHKNEAILQQLAENKTRKSTGSNLLFRKADPSDFMRSIVLSDDPATQMLMETDALCRPVSVAVANDEPPIVIEMIEIDV